MIHLPKVVYDCQARDGTWCRLPYPGHPKGCPNFPKCPEKWIDFVSFPSQYEWFAVVREFNLKKHAAQMKAKHPDWSERQCRNLLYWQGAVRSELFKETQAVMSSWSFGVLLVIPEAHGIDVFKTMAVVGIELQRNPDVVKKIMMVGKE